jgi:hypothetical protein
VAVILAAWEAEIRRIVVEGQLGQIVPIYTIFFSCTHMPMINLNL